MAATLPDLKAPNCTPYEPDAAEATRAGFGDTVTGAAAALGCTGLGVGVTGGVGAALDASGVAEGFDGWTVERVQ